MNFSTISFFKIFLSIIFLNLSLTGCDSLEFEVFEYIKFEKEGVELLCYDVIYHLSEKLQEILEGRITDADAESIVGEFTVKKVFASNKKMAVLGGEVLSGKVRKLSQFRVFRKTPIEEGEEIERTEAGEAMIGQAKIDTVQRGSDAVNEIAEVGLECGMKVDHSGLVFEEGDRLELFVKKG